MARFAVLVVLLAQTCSGLLWDFGSSTPPRPQGALVPPVGHDTPPGTLALPVKLGARRKSYVTGGCPNVGDSCSVTFVNRGPQLSVLGACSGTGVGSTYAPATCNFTNATVIDVNNNVQAGTCIVNPAGYPASIYNSTCSSSIDPLACSTPDGAFNCAGGPPGRCVYNKYAASSGDPCLDVEDCNDSSFCNSTLGVCMPLPDATYCYLQGQCGPGSFCNMSDVGGAYSCAPFVAVGSQCANTVVRNNVFGPNGGCAPNAFCYTNSSDALTGVCTLLNVLAPGTAFSAPLTDWFSYARVGARLCAGGLSVAVPDSAGNAGGLGLCAASLNLTAMGQACANCVYSANNGYPVYGDGSLVCAPVGPLSSCRLYPTSVYTAEYWQLTAAAANCTASARGPTGVPCAPGSTVAGRCASFLCATILAQLDVLEKSGSARWPLWASSSTTPACVASIADANATWKSSLSPAALCNMTLPRAFAARGWTCGGPAPSSLSPSVSMTPSASLSASMTVSPSQSLSMTRTASQTPSMSKSMTPSRTQTRSVTPSLTPSATLTASQTVSVTPSISLEVSPSPSVSATPSISATVTLTQTVTTGLTPTASPTQSGSGSPTPTGTPTQTVTTGLTPTASPPSGANAPASSSPSSAGPAVVGLAVGVTIGAVILVGAGAAVAYWALRRTPRTPFKEPSDFSGAAVVQGNPALGNGGEDSVQFVHVPPA